MKENWFVMAQLRVELRIQFLVTLSPASLKCVRHSSPFSKSVSYWGPLPSSSTRTSLIPEDRVGGEGLRLHPLWTSPKTGSAVCGSVYFCVTRWGSLCSLSFVEVSTRNPQAVRLRILLWNRLDSLRIADEVCKFPGKSRSSCVPWS